MEFIDKFIGNAEKLGALSATAVWAFFTLILLLYIVWDLRVKKQSSEQAWNARLKDSEADGMMARAIEKLADQIKELRHKLKCGDSDD